MNGNIIRQLHFWVTHPGLLKPHADGVNAVRLIEIWSPIVRAAGLRGKLRGMLAWPIVEQQQRAWWEGGGCQWLTCYWVWRRNVVNKFSLARPNSQISRVQSIRWSVIGETVDGELKAHHQHVFWKLFGTNVQRTM